MVLLSEFFISKADEELNENDERKNKALALLREMISKHPTIKNCRTGTKTNWNYLMMNLIIDLNYFLCRLHFSFDVS